MRREIENRIHDRILSIPVADTTRYGGEPVRVGRPGAVEPDRRGVLPSSPAASLRGRTPARALCFGAMTAVGQGTLFGRSRPRFDPGFNGIERIDLGVGAWAEYCPGWLAGDETAFEALARGCAWRAERRRMYQRIVDVPRLVTEAPRRGEAARLLRTVGGALEARYGERLPEIALNWYRDGRDGVAPHGDRVGRDRAETVIATVSLGAPRRFTLHPVDREAGAPRAFALGRGDLLVMGGTCQRTWRHAVPKAARAAPRISIVYRPAGERGTGGRDAGGPIGRLPARLPGSSDGDGVTT